MYRERKLSLYARFGSFEAWLIDILGRAICGHRAPQNGAYAECFQLSAPYRVEPLLLAGVNLDPAPLVSQRTR
jgi:hypothetical protein